MVNIIVFLVTAATIFALSFLHLTASVVIGTAILFASWIVEATMEYKRTLLAGVFMGIIFGAGQIPVPLMFVVGLMGIGWVYVYGSRRKAVIG